MTPGPNLTFRHVQPTDKDRILRFTQHTWEDGDYIEDVFDAWVAEPRGAFIAAVRNELVVSIAKITDLGHGELWLEGLRVDPEYRNQGVGQAMHEFNVAWARNSGARWVRFGTGEENTVSQSFGRESGFQRVGRFRRHGREPHPEPVEAVVLSESDLERLLPWLDSPGLRAAHGLYSSGRRWCSLNVARLRAHLKTGEVIGLPRGDRLRAWAIVPAKPRDGRLQAHHLDGDGRRSMQDIARAVSALAETQGAQRVDYRACESTPLGAALLDAGYEASDFVMWIFERSLQDEPAHDE